MQTHILGYPRIGNHRELKRACEQYWSGKISLEELTEVGKEIRLSNWKMQQQIGIDLIPSNDFSYYDHVLDMSLTVGAIPRRYHEVFAQKSNCELDLYFAMARGYQTGEADITAMEMTKWFDTNYHYIVPEFYKDQTFRFFSRKVVAEFMGALQAGIRTKPVIIGPVSYLLLGKEKEAGFDKIDLIDRLLPVYLQILGELQAHGAEWVQIDEPYLAMDIDDKTRNAFAKAYTAFAREYPSLKIIVSTYFGGLKDNLTLAKSLPISTLHVDLVRCPDQLDEVVGVIPAHMSLSLGIVDGRNVWINDLDRSLAIVRATADKIGGDRLMIAPSCSLLHSPCDLDNETDENKLSPDVKEWLAFAKQKLIEVATLKNLAEGSREEHDLHILARNREAVVQRKQSPLVHNQSVGNKLNAISKTDVNRKNAYPARRSAQQKNLGLPLFPTTTIGSFPQTKEVRGWRAKFKKGEITAEQYERFLKEEIDRVIQWQEEIGLDVLVHGEFERNDMVEYFGEQLNGIAFTQNGWVQSYGSRCVKPPIIFGDVSRSAPMTLFWSQYAQSLTKRPVKGMLTGPVTILQWSFVRDDQPRADTCNQIALAIHEEVLDLETAGIKIIQIDEPALREGLPLRKIDWQEYLDWAIRAFRLASYGVKDETQIHTHMCYAEFNDIIHDIAAMDADVITIECSRSQMELLDAFVSFRYPNEIGPGVYDIHSPRVPTKEEIIGLLDKACLVIPVAQLWVNPDCGLKTRGWEETRQALKVMVEAAKQVRQRSAETIA
jgi:5-methyltetrahydropteroyltriglutamate--homocysteine methyltransferase